MARRNYVDGPAVTVVLNEYVRKRKAALEAGEEAPPLPNEVAVAIKKIAENYASSGKFSRVPNRQDMVQDGILNAIENVAKSYDPDRSMTKNCFSYLTSLVYFGFLAHFRKDFHALRQKNAYLEALSDGIVTIGNQQVDAESHKALKAIRDIVDQHRMDEAAFGSKTAEKKVKKEKRRDPDKRRETWQEVIES